MGGDHDMARGGCGDDGHGHECDQVMPGFRFHPTEEELIEFYLRRKVEGKRFNVELIAFIDLYRHDPWDLPGLAQIGDKDWFFYVPRDRKYRNGDRPNRVTPSGYWKATGADRMVRVDRDRSIGLKKTLVFYLGKAPKGHRSSWIMNEYRLPHSEANRYQKEISLCRVYKRPGIEDNFHLITSTAPTKASGSKAAAVQKKHASAHGRTSSTARPPMFEGGHSSSLMVKAYNAHGAAGGNPITIMSSTSTAAAAAATLPASMYRPTAASVGSLGSTTSTEEDGSTSLYHMKGANAVLAPSTHALLNANSSTMATIPIDELSRAIGSYSLANPNQSVPSQGPMLPFPSVEKLWDWNHLLESPKVGTSFK